jgi:hypothetical protein
MHQLYVGGGKERSDCESWLAFHDKTFSRINHQRNHSGDAGCASHILSTEAPRAHFQAASQVDRAINNGYREDTTLPLRTHRRDGNWGSGFLFMLHILLLAHLVDLDPRTKM